MTPCLKGDRTPSNGHRTDQSVWITEQNVKFNLPISPKKSQLFSSIAASLMSCSKYPWLTSEVSVEVHLTFLLRNVDIEYYYIMATSVWTIRVVHRRTIFYSVSATIPETGWVALFDYCTLLYYAIHILLLISVAFEHCVLHIAYACLASEAKSACPLAWRHSASVITSVIVHATRNVQTELKSTVVLYYCTE